MYFCSVKTNLSINLKFNSMINYKLVKRKNPKNPEIQKYYPQPIVNGFVTLNQLAERIQDKCTLTIHDVKGIVDTLQRFILRVLEDGKSVRFGDFGSFHVTSNSVGQELADDCSIADVKKLHVRFRKSAKLGAALHLGNPKVKFHLVKSSED